jgi:hypothetical protein
MTLAVIEHAEYPFAKGNLTANGLQWSNEVDTDTADIDVEVESIIIRPPALGEILELEFGLTAAFRAISSATADITYKWQARNKGEAWIDLHPAVNKANIGTNYIEESCSGRFRTQEGLDSLPFEIRLVIRCNEAGEGRAKIKNSSYARIKYAAS